MMLHAGLPVDRVAILLVVDGHKPCSVFQRASDIPATAIEECTSDHSQARNSQGILSRALARLMAYRVSRRQRGYANASWVLSVDSMQG
jgi:hypothetical protein